MMNSCPPLSEATINWRSNSSGNPVGLAFGVFHNDLREKDSRQIFAGLGIHHLHIAALAD